MSGKDALTFDRLLTDAMDARISRRELARRATALGLGAPMIAALAGATTAATAGAQEAIELSFDAGATAGGGGKPNAALVDYCRIVTGGSQFELDRMVDVRLVTISADLSSFVGELAESWEIAGTTATFTLHQNAMWHDGTPLTAKDVAFTINFLADPASGSRWGITFASVVGYQELQDGTATELSGVTAADDYTVTIELAQADSGLIAGFMFISILPQHIFADIDRAKVCEQEFWTSGRIGAGPFKFVQLVEGERIEMEAFDDYFLGRPTIDKLNLLFFASTETSLAAFQEGSNAAALISVLNLDLVNSLEFAEVVTTPAGVGAIWLNSKLPELSDKRVRQAISYAIDRKTICDTLYLSSAAPVFSEVPYLAWTQSPDLNPYDYDEAKAVALLEEAGWTGDASFTLWYYYTDPVTQSAMEAVQQYLAAVNINVEIRFDDGGPALQQERDDGTWQMIYGSFGAQPNPANLTIVWGCQAEKDYAYCNPEFDSLMEQGLRTYDQAEQAEYYQQAIKLLNEDLPWVWLFDRKNLIAVNTGTLNTGGQTAFGPGHILYRNHAETWTVTE